MPSEEVLPRDVRDQLDKQNQRVKAGASGGVGGAAPENAATAHQRRVAMGEPEPEADQVAEEESVEEEVIEKVCSNTRCQIALDDKWKFCAACGKDLVREGPAKRLGIIFTEEDIQDYLFKGYIVRDLKILGKHKVTARSSQTKDLNEIDDYIMNGEWLKDEKGNERQVSDFLMHQVNLLCATAMSVQKFDGESVGKNLIERIKWFEERGSGFTDLAAMKVQLFNQALTGYLKKEDNILGS